MEGSDVRFKVDYWSLEENDECCLIHIGGLTEDSKTVHVIATGFQPHVYIELPTHVRGWNRAKVDVLFNYLVRACKADGSPVDYKLFKKFKLHYLELAFTVKLIMPNQTACRKLYSRCMRRMEIAELGSFNPGDFKVHEHNIDPILKMSALKGIKMAGWINVPLNPIEDEEEPMSTADISIITDWNNINPIDEEITTVVYPKYLCFDIECYSENHNSKLPDPTMEPNEVCQISCIVGRLYQPGRTNTLLSLGWPNPIPNTNVIRYDTEKELLLGFAELIRETDPDLFLGYNIMKFDWNYLIARAELLEVYIEFSRISRVNGKRAELKEITWNSSAYKDQVFRFLDPHGRVNVDVLCEVERNYKLPKYSLDAVSEFFLQEHKADLSARQLFLLYQVTRDVGPALRGHVTKAIFDDCRHKIETILSSREAKGVVAKLKKRMLAATTVKDLRHAVDEGMTIIGIYCVKDSDLTVRLCEKLNLWPTMVEMAKCMHVPMSYLHTRGQQIKVLAQVYRETVANNVIIPFTPKPKKGEETEQKYQGAIVIEANPGYYNLVLTFDFASLYPTTMIANNICYTTLVRPDDPTPDDQCHVIAWEEHVGCKCPKDPHPEKKVKKSDVRCTNYRFRFRKVVHHPDGTKEHEGLMPQLLRRLLSERKVVKKEMQHHEADLKMTQGLATPKDLEGYLKAGWKAIAPGTMTSEQEKLTEVQVNVLNAQQMALKVSSNSIYGTLGARFGYIPLVEGAASVTAMGRQYITMAIKYIIENFKQHGSFLVYGDTDSCMVTFRKLVRGTGEIINYDQAFEIGNQISKATTHYLRCFMIGVDETHHLTRTKNDVVEQLPLREVKKDDVPFLTDEDKIKYYEYSSMPLELAFENCYDKFLLLTKKRYMAEAVNRRGEVTSYTKKGVVIVRRDNCKFLRDSYQLLANAIFDGKSEQEIYYLLYDRIHALFTMQIPASDLIIYTGVQDVMMYAKRHKSDDPPSAANPYLDANNEPFTDPNDCFDPRLQYRNIPQALLSLKILRRGETIPPNTRLEYLYLENPDAEHQGDKAEDFTYYLEHKAQYDLRPDYFHYIEKQLMKPVSELLNVKFPHRKIKNEKIEDSFSRCIGELSSELLKHRIQKIRGDQAKIGHILASLASNPTGRKPNEVSHIYHAELVKVTKTYRSCLIMDKVRKHYGVRKVPMVRGKRGEEERDADSSVIKDMLKYRMAYAAVIGQLRQVFNLR